MTKNLFGSGVVIKNNKDVMDYIGNQQPYGLSANIFPVSTDRILWTYYSGEKRLNNIFIANGGHIEILVRDNLGAYTTLSGVRASVHYVKK